jgi:hypothetical protein
MLTTILSGAARHREGEARAGRHAVSANLIAWMREALGIENGSFHHHYVTRPELER